MILINQQELLYFINKNINDFHERRLSAVKKFRLKKLLKSKNPYLFKAKNVETVEQLISSLLSSYMSSQEETMFGAFLEKLAIFVCQKTFNGQKSPAEGIDLDFIKDGVRYLVSIKSGPHWGNSDQIKKMISNFNKAKKVINQGGKIPIVCVNGCCYGQQQNENQGSYIKKCGQSFWELISGDSEFYKKIVEPLGYKAKEKNDRFMEEHNKLLNAFSKEFSNSFLKKNGEIDWEKLIEFNSKKE